MNSPESDNTRFTGHGSRRTKGDRSSARQAQSATLCPGAVASLSPGFDADTPVFDHPWEAQVFALVVASHEAGVFTWIEWSSTLGAQEHTDYRAWVQALEQLLTRQGLAQPGQIGQLAEAWQRAAEATPHGKPILLTNDPHCTTAKSDEHETR